MAKIRPDADTSRWSRFMKWMAGGSTALDDAMRREYDLTAEPFAAPDPQRAAKLEQQREEHIAAQLREQ